MAKDLAKLLETPLQRRQALKLIAGTAGALTLAACGVAPEPTPNAKSNLLVLRARVKNLQGRDRERLRAIADFLDPTNRSQVDILGEYWAEDGLIVNGKPGGEFINDGVHIVVLAKGESAAAVRAWADQWADVLDIDSDEAAAIDFDPLDPDDGDLTFLVFERIEGATTPKAVFGAEPDDVDIASHHTLVNDGLRQMMIVRAPSRGAVYEWVNEWGYHQAIEVLRLSNLSEKLRTCTRSSPTVVDTAPLATALAAGPLAAVTPQPQEKIEVADYHPDGLLLTTDQKLGSFYFRHRATGRFLSIDGALRVVSVATPVPADKWTFSRGQISGQAIGYQLYYTLQHQGTGFFLTGDGKGSVGSGSDPNGRYVGTLSGLTTWQKYKIEVVSQFERDQKYLATDSNGSVYSRLSPDELADWDQWSDYHYPTELERTLQDLVTTTKYDAPWPEDGYTGDMKAAYDLIVTILAKSDLGPPKNGGVSDLSIVKADPDYPQSGEPLYAAAQAVYEHLDAEVNHFKTLQLWYGDGGYVQTLLNEVTINNLSVLQSDQILAHQPPPSMTLTYVLSGLITALAIGFAAAVPAPAGPVIGAIIAGAWRTYSTATGGAPKDTLSTTFANLEGDLRRTFNDLITDRETTYSAVGGNWGKLSEFAKLVFDGTLVWPGITDKVRAVSSQQFEISVWKTVANANWSITGTGTYLYYSDADGVNWASYYLRSPWDYLILVRADIFDGGSDYEGLIVDHCYLYNAPPGTLAKHLFDDVENGGLGISMTDFYLSRNGWAIPGNLG